MAICNLFNELENKNGTFFTFSQYLEDLTKERVDGVNHRVVPSKFYTAYITGIDNGIGLELTEKFENGLALIRNNGTNFPEVSSYIFWKYFTSLNPILNYCGDINFHSYNEYDGMGYSDIYCYIPNDGKCMDINIEFSNPDNTIESSTYLEGYPNKQMEKTTYEWCSNRELNHPEIQINPNTQESFKINTIIVLYDIYNGENKISHDIPLGIYFTGVVGTNMELSNEITKYVNNEDIYNQGTSYGLRICSRYVATRFEDGLVPVNVSIQEENYADICKVMTQMSNTINKMNEVVSQNYDRNYKELLAIFKNSRTNVPYIKNVGGVDYWFVNGKVQGPASYPSEDNECDSLKLVLTWLDNNILDKNRNNTHVLKLKCELYSNNVKVDPTKLYLNGNIIELDEGDIYGINEYPGDINMYNFVAEYYDNQTSQSVHISKVHPSYIMLGDEFNIMPSNRILLETRDTEYTYTNSDLKHVIYAYPKQYGKLESIKDSRGIEYINDFDFAIESINGVEYLIYKDKNPANVYNYTLTFK